jgi:hypothetical protein
MATKLLLLALLLLSGSSYGQMIGPNLIGAGGDYFKNSNYSVEWAVGEICTETFQNQTYLTQGLLQGSTSIVAANKEAEAIDETEYSIYPNPTHDKLNISVKVSNTQITNVTIQIYDMLGKQVEERITENKDISISLSSYSEGIYIVHLLADGKKIGSKKIYKL